MLTKAALRSPPHMSNIPILNNFDLTFQLKLSSKFKITLSTTILNATSEE